MDEETRKKIENLERQRENTRQLIKGANSQLHQDNLFNLPGLALFSGDSRRYELERNFFLQQLYDIEAQIDELKGKN